MVSHIEVDKLAFYVVPKFAESILPLNVCRVQYYATLGPTFLLLAMYSREFEITYM